MIRHQRRGVTILEALIAIAVIGVAFIAIATLQIQSLRVTSDSRADTELLVEAVQAFEVRRAVVLRDFAAYHRSCAASGLVEVQHLPDPPEACVGTVSGGVVWEVAGPGGSVSGGSGSPLDLSGFVREGSVRVDIAVTQGGRTVDFSQVLSCVDASDQPSFVNPNVCRLNPEDVE